MASPGTLATLPDAGGRERHTGQDGHCAILFPSHKRQPQGPLDKHVGGALVHSMRHPQGQGQPTVEQAGFYAWPNPVWSIQSKKAHPFPVSLSLVLLSPYETSAQPISSCPVPSAYRPA